MKADERAIIERAAEWMALLEDGGTAEDRKAFGRWLRESPRHVEESLALSALHQATEGFDPTREMAFPEDDGAEVVALHQEASSTRRRVQWRWPAAAAAAVIAALMLSVWFGVFGVTQHYATAVGEQRAFDLPDGSIVHLNTNSQLEVRFTDTGRDIRLLSGEALFRVAADRQRPFRVSSGESVMQAIGTQFNVYRHGDASTMLAVLEGRVRVASVDLSAGEGVQIASDGQVGTPMAVNAAEVTAWQQRRLMFRKDVLADVVREFNRYSNSRELVVEGAEVAQRRLSGVFDADDPNSLLQFLAEDPTLRFQNKGRRTIIRAIRD